MQNEYICKDKTKLRKYLKELRAKVDDRAEKERKAIENILPQLYGKVLVYVPIGSELSTIALIEELMRRADITVFVPYTVDSVITPVRLIKLTAAADRLGNVDGSCYAKDSAPKSIDCCVTPLLGYNDSGYRIGYGKGCYDKFFSCGTIDVSKKIGLAFDCQKCDFVADKHDVALDMCVTESGIEVFS